MGPTCSRGQLAVDPGPHQAPGGPMVLKRGPFSLDLGAQVALGAHWLFIWAPSSSRGPHASNGPHLLLIWVLGRSRGPPAGEWDVLLGPKTRS